VFPSPSGIPAKWLGFERAVISARSPRLTALAQSSAISPKELKKLQKKEEKERKKEEKAKKKLEKDRKKAAKKVWVPR
jgi:hypothetical protein